MYSHPRRSPDALSKVSPSDVVIQKEADIDAAVLAM